jgi:protein arginine kinase activator
MFNFDENNNMLFDETTNMNFVQDKVCPKCKTALNDVLKTGIVGCANCYKVFENEIRDILLNKQGSINHIGKVSSKHISKLKVREKIKELETQKNIAAASEDFIVAESLKNQIEKLKGELENERL